MDGSGLARIDADIVSCIKCHFTRLRWLFSTVGSIASPPSCENAEWPTSGVPRGRFEDRDISTTIGSVGAAIAETHPNVSTLRHRETGRRRGRVRISVLINSDNGQIVYLPGRVSYAQILCSSTDVACSRLDNALLL